jgi:Ca2+/Na+ antiporter
MKMRTQQWIRVEEKTNYWYLYKIEFKKIPNNIKSIFSLNSTTHEDVIWKYVWATAYAFLFYIFFIFIFIFVSSSEITTLKFISYSLIYYIIFCYIYVLFRYWDSWVYLEHKFNNKLKIFTDNVSDTEDSLDKVFVWNINWFFDLVWKDKKYNFYFIKNELYIYHDLKSLDWTWFLEFSLFKNLNGNINKFLDFYKGFHSIVKLSEKLNNNKTV